MSIEVIYRVVKANGELAGEYMDKKLADAHDQKLDCIYTVVELMLEHTKDLEESVAEGIAEHLVDNKSVLLNALKKIKDSPSAKDVKAELSSVSESEHATDAIELLDTNRLNAPKKMANA